MNKLPSQVIFGIFLFFTLGGVNPPPNQRYTPLAEGYVPTQIIVRFSPDATSDKIRRAIRKVQAKTILEIPNIGAVVLQIPEGEALSAIAELSQHKEIIYAEPNFYAEATDIIPNDPGWGNQYNLAAIHAPAGWELNTGAIWVTIAILDSGVDLSHPDLFVRILPGYDFVNNDSVAQDDNGHGTHVAAIASASTNNNVGVAGVNWGANILPVKVLNAAGNGTYANVAAGIVWATDHGAQVINLSLGGGSPSFVLSDAVDYAYNHGVTLVAATGNAGAPAVLYPAAYPAVIAVGATDSSNSWASLSNYGPEVDVVAPGINIYSAYPGGGYGYRSGTSMSAPHVSGLAAILWGIPGNAATSVRNIIEATALDLGAPGWDPYYGSGLIQIDFAILQAQPLATATFTPTAFFTPTASATFTAPPTFITESPAQNIQNTPSSPILEQTSTLDASLPSLPSLSNSTPVNIGIQTSASSIAEAETPEVSAQQIAQSASTPPNHQMGAGFQTLPCCGILLILSGLILLLWGRRKGTSKKKYQSSIFL